MTTAYLAAVYGSGVAVSRWPGGCGWHGPPVWFGVVGGIVWLLFWAALIIVAVLLVRRLVRSRSKVGDSAVAVLGERYARGEIDEEEYRQRLGVLREQQQT